MLENPPYRDSTENNTSEEKGVVNKSFIYNEYKKNGTDNASHRDISNLFIWSAFKYYLRQPTDSYIVFSPVKYFKSTQIINKQFQDGYLLNRKHFHAGKSAISLIWWQNVDEQRKEFILKAFDIEIDRTTGDKQEQVNNGAIKYEKDVIVKKVYKRFKDYYQDNRKFEDDVKGVCCESNGIESIKEYGKKEPLYNKNIIGYLDVHSF
jgi:hypothetical protein